MDAQAETGVVGQLSGAEAARARHLARLENPRISPEIMAKANEAAIRYKGRVGTAEKKAGSALHQAVEMGLQMGGLAILELFGLATAGYSPADLIVAYRGIMDVYYGKKEDDRGKMLRGGLKIAAAAVPGIPGSITAPIIDKVISVKPTINEQSK